MYKRYHVGWPDYLRTCGELAFGKREWNALSEYLGDITIEM